MELQFLTGWMRELDEESVIQFLKKFIDDQPSTKDAENVMSACQKGMSQIGEMFEKGEYFVGDLIFAGELLTEVIDMLNPILGIDPSVKIGSVALGEVHGDPNDIGKDIFQRMIESAGFQVINLV